MRIAMVGHKRVPSREGGIEVVVEELAARMVMHGHSVTCYNRTGHHVSGKEYDMVNTMAAIESGITEVQSALGGLGGCPFAPGASGNLSTEDMIWMLNEMGYETGIEFSKVLAAAKYQASHIPGNYSGHHIHIEQETPCKF